MFIVIVGYLLFVVWEGVLDGDDVFMKKLKLILIIIIICF